MPITSISIFLFTSLVLAIGRRGCGILLHQMQFGLTNIKYLTFAREYSVRQIAAATIRRMGQWRVGSSTSRFLGEI
jgi:hypothetical protein